MSVNDLLIAALLRAYPRAWLNEYGNELTGILKSCPLTVNIAINILWNGMHQRVRATDPATGIGLAAMIVVALRFASNIATPAPLSEHAFSSMLQPSRITLPTIVATPLTSGVFFVLLAFLGAWTQVRTRGTLARSGRAAVRVAWLAGLPFVVAGSLMLLGLLDVVVVEPGTAARTLNEHVLSYFYYRSQPLAPAPSFTWWAVMLAPVFALPQAWLWGVTGGAVARRALPASRTDLPSQA